MRDCLFDELCIKHEKKRFLIFAIACVGFLSFIYTPIYLLLSSNVLWRNSILLFLWTEVIATLADFTFYWGSFAFLIYIYLRFGKEQTTRFSIIYAIAVAARYIVTMIVNFALMSFPGWDVLFGEDLPSALFTVAMDILQLIGVLLITEFACRRPLMNLKIYRKGEEGEQMLALLFPIEGLFELKKPLNKLCFFSALVPAGVKVLSRLYYDIFFWGLPQDAGEWILIATYYIGDIATLFIGYFVLLYLLQAFYTGETKRKIDFES